MSFDVYVMLIGLILIIIVLVAFLPFLFWEDPVEDNNSTDLKVGDRVYFGGRIHDNENSFSTAKCPDNYEYDWRKNSFGKPRIEK